MQTLYPARLLIVPCLRGIWRRGLLRAENDSRARNPHETKSHERTEFLVTRNQGKHPDRGCAKASHDDRISGRGELDRASPKKMCEKFWTLSETAALCFFLPSVDERGNGFSPSRGRVFYNCLRDARTVICPLR